MHFWHFWKQEDSYKIPRIHDMQKLPWVITWLNILLLNLDFKLCTFVQLILNLCHCLCDECVLKSAEVFSKLQILISISLLRFFLNTREYILNLNLYCIYISKTYIVFVTVSNCRSPAHVFILFMKTGRTSTVFNLIIKYQRNWKVFKF